MDDLKPCPFCGSEDVLMDCNTYGKIEDHFGICNNLDCVTEGPVRPTEAEAIKAWNTRAMPESDDEIGVKTMPLLRVGTRAIP